MEKISVIVPIFNAEKTLDRCLHSLHGQTYADLEVLLIDDGSTDNSAAICKQYACHDERFRYIYQKNAGVAAARNAGLTQATGEYVGFCDSDDWIEDGMYEFLYMLMKENSADISVCTMSRDFPGMTAPAQNDSKVYEFNSQEAIIEMHRGGRFMGHLCDKLFKKCVIADKLLRPDLALFEDMVFVWECFRDSKKIVYQDVSQYHYIQNTNSAMNHFKEASWSIQKACAIMLEYMQSNFPEHIVFAQRTVLYGNMVLARQLSEAGLGNHENYLRIRTNIDESYTRDAVALLKSGTARDLAFFRCGRYMFNFYIWILTKRRKLLQKARKEAQG